MKVSKRLKLKRAMYKSLYLVQRKEHPPYAYMMYHAAMQAIALGIKKISVIEFGVAGGNSLICMENHAMELSELFDIEFEVYGFDTAGGLPELEGYKDIMHQWKAGHFPMDVEKLKSRLKMAQLVLGNVKDTVPEFMEKYNPAPIGAISFDVDLYSSTRDALKIFDAVQDHCLPRVRCYFDDIVGTEISLSNEYMGEKLAINEYNDAHPEQKVTPVYYLRGKKIQRKWYRKCYAHHNFAHPRYTDFIAKPEQTADLKD